ncbi:MAG: molybdopterin cofactor-binding domain-containing protein [Sphingobium sp.]
MRRSPDQKRGISAKIDRRTLLIGGGATAGLLLGWGLWPRSYRPNLPVGSNETLINAFLKIDTAGQIIVVVPQLEMGQGVTTVLPQILADELGADWRTVAVQGAPVSPLYANTLLAREFLESDWSRLAGGAGDWAMHEMATRSAMMLTGGSTSIRNFAGAYREAGAAARVLLCKAAGARWGIPFESCRIENGIVTDGQRTLRIGELAGEAAGFTLPDVVSGRAYDDERLLGSDVPRLDIPSKIDGSHNFAADIRLPDMVYASIRQGPPGAVRLKSSRDAEAKKVTGFLQLVKEDQWVAACATNWWAANKALDLIDPVFEVAGPPLDGAAIEKALDDAFERGEGSRIYAQGDLAASFAGARLIRADYRVAPALHLAIEPPCATARVEEGRAEVWAASQAPAFCRKAVAKALGLAETAVNIYPVSAGGSFGRRFEHEPAVQAALIARALKRPVQLLYSRAEDIISDRPRPPANARMWAKLGTGGRIESLAAKVSAPAANPQLWDRIAHGKTPVEAALRAGDRPDRHALSGMPSPYGIPIYAIDHYPADVRLPVGRWRANADSYTCFFTESFIDELAYSANIEPFSFRMQHLGGQTRLARCLTTVTAMGGWQGGTMGSGQGIAIHAMDGGFIALMIEATLESGSIRATNIVAVADVGNQPHPDIARQQIEGGILFGLGAATGAMADYTNGLPRRVIMGRMGLPRLADIGDVSVELLPSEAEPAGIGQIGVPPVAPALAGALFTLTGRRNRAIPLVRPQ